jgi:superfamily II DNA/RNA helicase
VFDFFLAQSAQMFDVEALWGFQERAATASLPSTSRVFLNVSTGGGKTLALLWPVVLDALLAQKAKQFSLSLCFVPLLALQSDLVRRTQSNVMLKDVLHVLSLSVSDDMKTLDALFASKFVWSKSVLVFLNPERFARIKTPLLHKDAPRVSTILFDEAHTYVEWDSFRPAFDSLAGILRDFPNARCLAATATLTKEQLEAFSLQIGVSLECWKLVIEIVARRNHFYHVVEERVLLRYAPSLFAEDRLPCLVVVNSLAALVALRPKVVAWSGLPESSVVVFAAGLSDEHQQVADTQFRDPANRMRIMIATSAYSLGIDAFICSVVHYGVPRDLAAYLQGVGRAGRDPSIREAHCTLVVDAAGLQAASKEMRQFLGAARQKPKKPDGSSSMAQCTVCLSWRYLGKDVVAPKAEEAWICEQAGAVCSNVSRLPCCVEVMALRFLKREQGRLDAPLQISERECGRCDLCNPLQPISVPPIASFVRVISATHAFFGQVGQVISVSDDSVKVMVNFGGVFCSVELPHDVVCVCENVVLPPAMAAPVHTNGPQVLKRNLKVLLEKRFGIFRPLRSSQKAGLRHWFNGDQLHLTGFERCVVTQLTSLLLIRWQK